MESCARFKRCSIFRIQLESFRHIGKRFGEAVKLEQGIGTFKSDDLIQWPFKNQL